jgi:hypothetical protein
MLPANAASAASPAPRRAPTSMETELRRLDALRSARGAQRAAERALRAASAERQRAEGRIGVGALTEKEARAEAQHAALLMCARAVVAKMVGDGEGLRRNHAQARRQRVARELAPFNVEEARCRGALAKANLEETEARKAWAAAAPSLAMVAVASALLPPALSSAFSSASAASANAAVPSRPQFSPAAADMSSALAVSAPLAAISSAASSSAFSSASAASANAAVPSRPQFSPAASAAASAPLPKSGCSKCRYKGCSKCRNAAATTSSSSSSSSSFFSPPASAHGWPSSELVRQAQPRKSTRKRQPVVRPDFAATGKSYGTSLSAAACKRDSAYYYRITDPNGESIPVIAAKLKCAKRHLYDMIYPIYGKDINDQNCDMNIPVPKGLAQRTLCDLCTPYLIVPRDIKKRKAERSAVSPAAAAATTSLRRSTRFAFMWKITVEGARQPGPEICELYMPFDTNPAYCGNKVSGGAFTYSYDAVLKFDDGVVVSEKYHWQFDLESLSKGSKKAGWLKDRNDFVICTYPPKQKEEEEEEEENAKEDNNDDDDDDEGGGGGEAEEREPEEEGPPGGSRTQPIQILGSQPSSQGYSSSSSEESSSSGSSSSSSSSSSSEDEDEDVDEEGPPEQWSNKRTRTEDNSSSNRKKKRFRQFTNI